jgi:hypothetical protein
MRKLLLMLGVSAILMSCSVQQFAVNTEVEPFENGGRVFGEKTNKLKKGEDYVKSGTIFVFGVNVLSDYETDEMAKKINAEHYTIETKSNFLTLLAYYGTGGVLEYKVVKVIKRTK